MGGTPVRILLVRHGETVYNVEGRWQGQSDSPLTERGRAQARELARALADEPITAVYSSDLPRRGHRR
jgi:probable phosphoglycerate mutase